MDTGIEINADKIKEYAGNIHHSGIILLETINDLLDFAKFESGQLELSFEEVDVRAKAQLCLEIITQMPGAGGIQFRNEVPEDFPCLELDPTGIRQVFLNLFSNAVKATADGGTVTIKAIELNEDAVEICISDTGKGIPEHFVVTLFEPYSGNNSNYVRDQKGTGLGLSIVRQLVESLGGVISVESTVGQGTAFRMKFSKIRTMPPAE